MFAVGAQLVFEFVACIDLVLLGQKFHRKVNARQVAPGRWQVARLFGATGQEHRVKVFFELLGADGFFGPVGDFGALGQFTHDHAGANCHAFGFELFDTAVDV